MIEQVLAEIAAAERRAEEIIEQANVAAREISLSTAAECDALRFEADEEIKSAVKLIMAEAQEIADKEAAEAAKEAELNAQALIRAAEKNVRSAGEWIAENIIKGKF